MNYTYLPSTPYSSTPTIIMTTNPSSKKTSNLLQNPNVSLLVHDWVSHRPPTTNDRRGSAGGSPPPEQRSNSLAALLLNLNTSALSSISATINGEARLVGSGTQEERYFKQMHLENNTFGDEVAEGDDMNGQVASTTLDPDTGDGGRGCFIEGEEVRVVVVKIKDGRVADWKGAVRDWSISSEEVTGPRLVNGIS